MSNLLQKASIVTTPTAYGVGVLNSIKPAYALGEELVTNGNFDTDSSNWFLTGSSFWINSSIEVPTGGLTQQFTLKNSITYKITFDVIQGGGINGGIYVNTRYNTPDFANNVGATTIGVGGTYTFTFRMNAEGNGITLTRRVNNQDIRVDNVSVVEVTDADFDFTRNSSATRVNPDYLIQDVSILSSNLVQNGNFSELGSELITNGNFETDSDWSKFDNTTISNGKLNLNVTTTGTKANQSNVMTIGKTYKVVFDVANYVDGNVYISGFSIPLAQRTSSVNGTFTFYSESTSTTFTVGTLSASTNLSIDNVSVKQVDPNDYWTLGTGWSIGTNKAISDGTTSNLQQFSVDTSVIGKKYNISLSVSDYSSGFLSLSIGGYDYATPTITGNGEHTRTLEVTNASSNDRLYIGSSSFDGSVTNISLIEIQQTDIPRLDYTNGTASILLEPQSTNLVTYSEDFSQYFVSGSPVVNGGFLAPDGTNNAYKITNNTSSSVFLSGVSNLNSTSTRTIYAKTVSGTGTASLMSYFGNTNNVFTLTDQWQRFEVNGTTTSTGESNFYAVDFRGAGTLNEVLIWGAQAEALSYATSYIPTSGSTVTRAAESLNNAANSDLINSTEGVLYAEIAALANDGTFRYMSLFGDTSNHVQIYYKDSANKIAGLVRSEGNVSFIFTHTLTDATNFIKIAIKYKQNDFALWVNGVEVATDTSGNAPIGLSELDFDYNGGNFFFGRCKTVAVFKEALSDTELACLTSTNNREIFLNYYYRMQYVGANTEALSCAEQTFNI